MLGEEEEEEVSTQSRATGSTGSLQGAIRAQGSTGWCWSQEQRCSRAGRETQQSSKASASPWCSPCRLSTDNKPGFTCLPGLINHFPEDFWWWPNVWNGFWPAKHTLQKCVSASITSPLPPRLPWKVIQSPATGSALDNDTCN